MTSIFTPGCKASSVGCKSAMVFLSPSATVIVFSPCAFKISKAKVGWPLNRARLSCSCWLSTIRATCPKLTAYPPRFATTIFAKSSGRLIRPLTCTTCSFDKARTAPVGSS